jgi:hypothetical protein
MDPGKLFGSCVVAGMSGFGAVYFLLDSRSVQQALREPPALADFAGTEVAGEADGKGPVPKTFEELERLTSDQEGRVKQAIAQLEILQRMNADELEVLLEKSQLTNGGAPQGPLKWIRSAGVRLGEIAPKRATALWMRLAEKTSFHEWDGLLEHWKKTDPPAFFQWFEGLPQFLQMRANRILAEVLVSNPAFIDSTAERMGDNPTWMHAAGAMALSGEDRAQGVEAEQIARAMERAKALSSPTARTAALVGIALSLMGSEEGRQQLTGNPELQTAIGVANPPRLQSYTSPFRGRTEGITDPVLRREIVRTGIGEEARKDAVAATQKVEALAGTADYADAVRGLVDGIHFRDPQVALEWALSIPEAGPQRMAALETAARAFFQDNPTQAIEWVAKAPISAVEYRQLTGRDR